jgi:hypothetical protein
VPAAASRSPRRRAAASALTRVAHVVDRVARVGGQLDHRGEQLVLDLTVLDVPGLFDHLVSRGNELEGLRVQEHDLLLDADRPRAPASEGLLDHFPRTP